MRLFSLHAILLFFVPNCLFATNLQQTFRSNSLTFEKLEDSRVVNSHARNDYDFIFTLGVSYIDAPLTVKNANNSNQLEEVIPSMQSIHFGLGYYFKPWLMIGAMGNYSLYEDNQGRSFKGFSDPQIRLKLRLLSYERFAVSVIPFLNINTDQGEFVTGGLTSNSLNGTNISPISDQGLGYGAKVSAEYIFDWAQFVANVGYRQSDNAITSNPAGVTQIDYRQALLTGIGAYIPVSKKWGVNLEYLRRWSFPLLNDDQEQNEFFVGAAGGLTNDLHAFAGVGFGNIFSDSDGSDYRASIGVKYVGNIFASKRQPLEAIYVPKTTQNIDARSENSDCPSQFVFGSSNHVIVKFKHNVGSIDSQNNSLNKVAEILRNRPDISRINIQGHTSLAGNSDYNQKLSEQRAARVKRFLTDKGIRANKIFTRGYGETRPINRKDDGSNNNQYGDDNRRVEFEVILNETNKDCR